MSSQCGELRRTSGWDRSGSLGAPQLISTGFASWQRYWSDVAQQKPTKLCTVFGCLLNWYTTYTFLTVFARLWNFAGCKIHIASSKSCALVFWYIVAWAVGASQTLRRWTEGDHHVGHWPHLVSFALLYIMSSKNTDTPRHPCLYRNLSYNVSVSLLTRKFRETVSKKLLFLLSIDDQKMCSWVHGAAVLAGRLPLKIDQRREITDVMTFIVIEVTGTAGLCSTSKPLLCYFNFTTTDNGTGCYSNQQ